MKIWSLVPFNNNHATFKTDTINVESFGIDCAKFKIIGFYRRNNGMNLVTLKTVN